MALSSHVHMHVWLHACMIAPAQAVTSADYGVLYYKSTNKIGIRRKFGGKEQIWSFGGSACGKDEAGLRHIADDCLLKLDAGESEDSVLEFAVDQLV